MNAHTKENCVENDDSSKLPVTGHYAYFVRFIPASFHGPTLPLVTRMFGQCQMGAQLAGDFTTTAVAHNTGRSQDFLDQPLFCAHNSTPFAPFCVCGWSLVNMALIASVKASQLRCRCSANLRPFAVSE